MDQIQLQTQSEVPMAGVPLSVASEKLFQVYLLLSVRFYFIFLLCLIFFTSLFFFLFFFFSFLLAFRPAFQGCLIFAGLEGSTPARKQV